MESAKIKNKKEKKTTTDEPSIHITTVDATGRITQKNRLLSTLSF